MKKKYELTEETRTLAGGKVLHRIRSVSDFAHADGTKVRAGDLGGWIETEDNLSHFGKAWVFDNAKVFGNALVYGNARVFDYAEVFGEAWVRGEAHVYCDAQIYDKAKVSGSALVGGDAQVYDDADVGGKAEVGGKAHVCCRAEICGHAKVNYLRDYAVFKNAWSSGRWFTYTRSNAKWRVGCFYGTGEELIAKAYMDSKLSGQCYEAIVRAQEAIDKAIDEANEAK